MLVFKFAIANTLRLFCSETLRLMNFVVRIGTFKEEHITFTFKGENVGTNTVEGTSGRG